MTATSATTRRGNRSTPGAKAPATEAPATEAPATEAPATEAPAKVLVVTEPRKAIIEAAASKDLATLTAVLKVGTYSHPPTVRGPIARDLVVSGAVSAAAAEVVARAAKGEGTDEDSDFLASWDAFASDAVVADPMAATKVILSNLFSAAAKVILTADDPDAAYDVWTQATADVEHDAVAKVIAAATPKRKGGGTGGGGAKVARDWTKLAGTALVGTHHEATFTATIAADGTFVAEGVSYDTPSAAAKGATGQKSVSGTAWWRVGSADGESLGAHYDTEIGTA